MNNTIPYISFLKENRSKSQSHEIFNQRISDSRKVYEKFSDSFILRNCPICGCKQYEDMEPFDDRYGIVKCNNCTSIYVNPCPSLEALEYYYNECECNKILGKLLKSRVGKKGVIINERSSEVIEIIKKLKAQRKKIRILDIGCNSGAFLYELYSLLQEENLINGISLVGIDIDKNATDKPVSDVFEICHSSAEEFVGNHENSFDLILHFELIEHLHHPYEFLESVQKLLTEGGYTYFHTPNGLGLDNQALSYNDFRPLAHAIFPPMHLQAFTTQNILHFLLRVGLKMEEISTPGNFDIDIVKNFLSSNNKFSFLHSYKTKKDLAGIQRIARLLGCSSHMAVKAKNKG
ncbi:MAG: class I SAM-dependent methyltransferase [Opitutae bacterium]|jgi:2-polyprenyl-6-hydroxyphenyl methylase / 3-demethylubiquinone-9 3-methyltransferase|nr:class I SAM-dependent methyltransferase [Opitutae bacterium]